MAVNCVYYFRYQSVNTLCKFLSAAPPTSPQLQLVLVQMDVLPVGPAEHVQYSRRLHNALDPPAPDFGEGRVHVLEEVVRMAHEDPDDVHLNGVPHQEREGQHHEGQVRGRESERPEEGHLRVLVPSPPGVGHHEGQRVAQELASRAQEGGHEGHHGDAEGQHEDEVGGAAAEVTFLQEAAVPNKKVHVEEEIDREVPEEEVGGEEPPHLPLGEDQVEVVVQHEGRDYIEGAACRGEKGQSEVKAGDDGDFHVPGHQAELRPGGGSGFHGGGWR